MELEQAFRLSVFYILKMDACTSIEAISKLHKQMAIVYTRKMMPVKKRAILSKAQHLLKYSDYSLIEIANYLAFSSQSHFIQTFKKLVGLTPKNTVTTITVLRGNSGRLTYFMIHCKL